MGWIGGATVAIGEQYRRRGPFREVLCFEHHHHPLRPEPIQRRTASSGSREHRALPSWNVSRDQPVTSKDLEEGYPSLYPAKLSKIPESQLVFFLASSAFFTLAPGYSDHSPLAIMDSSGIRVGSMTSTATCSVPDKGGQNGGISDFGKHEFVAVASQTPMNVFDYWKLLVLQIEWRDDIAFRVGCGEIYEES